MADEDDGVTGPQGESTGAAAEKPPQREASTYYVYEVHKLSPVGASAGEVETLKRVGELQALSSNDADRQWRQKLVGEFESGEREGEVEYRCVSARNAEPVYFAAAEQKVVVTGGTR